MGCATDTICAPGGENSEAVPRSDSTPELPVRQTEVFQGGRSDGEVVFSGHGAWNSNIFGRYTTTRVPDGTSVAVYTENGATIDDLSAFLIEAGASDAPPLVRMYGPGDRMPNFTLYPPEGLTIFSRSKTVSDPTKLSDLLQSNMGTCHWAACAVRSGGN
ncbi:putative adhesin [Catenulispora pinistramenti]|uniref:putative adhesin n=1 Tax=Catenulispora pinistramenti TaxID=2705254 RepID=UPI0034D4DC6B